MVCILREENFNRQGVIDYNFLCFRDAISEVFELRMKSQKLPTVDERQEYLMNGAGDSDDENVDDDDDQVVNSRTGKIV